MPEQLLAAIFDVLQAANWQRGGGQGRKPDRLPRPGVEPTTKAHGAHAMPIDEMRKRLGLDETT